MCCFENVNITNNVCNVAFIQAFPIKVAPKNVENPIPKCPQVIPAKSNKGFGI